MVAFNQPDQDINPANTAFWARPIREPKVDESGATLGRTIGGAIGEGLKFADQYTGEVAKATAYKESGALRDQFVEALNTARESVEPQPLGAPKSLSPEQRQNLPQVVQNVGSKVDMLGKAMESGKLSETDYYGRLDAMAKRLRAQFPGYREDIDSAIAKSTGVHPANQYIRGMISDMNRLVAQRGEAKDRFQSQLEYAAKEQIVTPQEIQLYTQQHDAGKIDENFILGIIASRKSQKAQEEEARFDWASKDRNAKESAEKAENDINHIARGMMEVPLQNETVATGTHKGENTAALLTAYGQGKTDIPDEDWVRLGAQETTQYNLMHAQLMKRINEPIPGDPNHESLADKARKGGKNAEEVVDNALKDYKARVDQTAGKNFEMRHMSKELVQARIDDSQNLATKDPYVAATLANADLARKHLGDQGFTSYLQQHQDAMGTLDKTLHQLFSEDQLAGMIQPRKAAGGKAYEFVHQIQDAQNKGVDDPNFYQLLRKGSDMITDKRTDEETRAALIDYYFGPNSGQLVSIATKGHESVYSQLYTPLMARSIAKYNPDKYQEFEHGAEANAMALFTKSINALKTAVMERPPVSPTFKGVGEPKYEDAPVSVTWYGNHFEVTGKAAAYYKGDVDKVNTMVTGLKAVYDNDPSNKFDVDTFMFERLTEMGFDPNKNVSGLPEQFMKALMAARGHSSDTGKPTGASKSESGTGVAE